MVKKLKKKKIKIPDTSFKMKSFEKQFNSIALLNKKKHKKSIPRVALPSYNSQIEPYNIIAIQYWIIADKTIFYHSASCQIAIGCKLANQISRYLSDCCNCNKQLLDL